MNNDEEEKMMKMKMIKRSILITVSIIETRITQQMTMTNRMITKKEIKAIWIRIRKLVLVVMKVVKKITTTFLLITFFYRS